MDAIQVSAKFAAFVWHDEMVLKDRHASNQFAKENWPTFLPCANEGLGRLLLKIAEPRRERAKKSPSRRLVLV
jgi:hypothetical protein